MEYSHFFRGSVALLLMFTLKVEFFRLILPSMVQKLRPIWNNERRLNENPCGLSYMHIIARTIDCEFSTF